MVPRRPPRSCCWTARRVEGSRLTRCQIASRRADRVQVETLTPQQVRRVCTDDSVSALARDPQAVGADCRRACMVCDMLHCLAWIHNRGAPLHPYIPYYNRRSVLACTASRRGGGIWYVLEVLRRCDTPQRGAGGIIAACVGLVSWAVGLGKISGNTPVKPCVLFCVVGGITAQMI